ncbi:M48 family metallopeptidase [Thiomonas bhubaneswarensis]|uniref:Predicted metal-dependent hydrolase n=1 Tax=Thiomonas bhubaneswarensis TaxID=339866 RepID=A0A0K6HT58_9BURK|nr:SprT family zinc-dependent metalloprotease [Thiomonas bhubaneswarensis]CUA94031.1 Predicted metal-dependent hydrolase [Thiomonas bhubaneswarensis]
MPRTEPSAPASLAGAAQLGLFDWPEPEAVAAVVPVTVAPIPAPEAPTPPPVQTAPMHRHDDGIHRFDWSLHRAARRTLALRVDDRGVRVMAPHGATLTAIHAFVASHAAWVVRKLKQRAERLQALGAARIDWCDGGRLPYLGGTLLLRVRGDKVLRHAPETGELHLPLPHGSAADRVRDSVAAWMQRQALALFTARTAHFARQLGVQVSRVGLSQATTRWGSAKSDGSIRLHWRLLHFSPSLVDYVVAHEVAHLREMNHSPRFWAHVGSLYPEFRQARQHLRQSTLPPWD